MRTYIDYAKFEELTQRGVIITHIARIITYADLNRRRTKMVSLLTNDIAMKCEDVTDIYKKRWEIELLFKQLKQNFPLRYFYGESANAIKIQIWVTLIANLLLMVIQKRIKRTWSFSGLATMVRMMLMYYVNCYTFLGNPEKDWYKILEEVKEKPPEPTFSIKGTYFEKKHILNACISALRIGFSVQCIF